MKFTKNSDWVGVLIVCLFLYGCEGLIGSRGTDSAILALEEYIEKNPKNVEKRVILAGMYVEKYKNKKYNFCLDKAINQARVAISLNPDHGQAHLILSHALLLKGSNILDEKLLNEAVKEYKEALRIKPVLADDDDLPPIQFMDALIYLARSKEDNKFIDNAIKKFEEAIRLKPKYAPSHFMLGAIYYEQGKNELALLEFIETAILNPDNPDTHKLLGDIYGEKIHTGEDNWNDEAIEQGINEYKKVIRLTPEDDEAHRELSLFYMHKGLYELQLFEAKEAVKLNKSMKNFRALGRALYNNGKYDQALKEFKNALKLEPDSSDLYYEIAFTYYLQNRFKDAISEFKRYFELINSPNIYEVLWQHFSLKRTGKDAEAQKLLEDFTTNFKGEIWESYLLGYYQGKITESELLSKTRHKCDMCEAYFNIGCTYLLNDDMEKAKEFFQKTIDTKVFCYYEYIAATARLKKLGEKEF